MNALPSPFLRARAIPHARAPLHACVFVCALVCALPASAQDASMHAHMHHEAKSPVATPTPAQPPERMPEDMPRTPIPPVTDEDRAAAERPLAVMHTHGDGVHSLVLFNRLEAWHDDAGRGLRWEGRAWIGGDVDRLWLRSEGERSGGKTDAADIEALYGHSVSPWWDAVVGVRHDTHAGAARTSIAIGLQGMAPQKFEATATAYIDAHGRVAARLGVERDIPLSAHWYVQPMVEANLQAHRDPRSATGAARSSLETGLRLRYEVSRRFAPYIGVVHERRYGMDTGSAGPDTHDTDTRWVFGVRFWF